MNREEFSEKVLALENMLFHISYGILHNMQDCEDVVQEAILKAYAAQDKLRQQEYFKTWLTRILINECYTFLRKRSKEYPYGESISEDKAAPGTFIKEEYLDLYESINKLPKKEQICVQLYYMEGYSLKEIARVLRIPEGTVKSKLSRARASLRKKLQ